MSKQDEYKVPRVWEWQQEDGSKFSSTNRPTSGPTHEQALPVGDHDLQLYSMATPNGQKVTILLEELLAAGVKEAEYDAWSISIGDGEQFSSGFVQNNPNSKIPAMMDYSVNPPLRLFESGAIMQYLAEKFDAFIPEDPIERTECRNWLFWQVGSAPYLGGGFGHFYSYAPYAMQYPIDRFTLEIKRQLDVLDKHLSYNTYMAGEHYSIADMATWPWYGNLVLGKLYDAAEFLQVDNYTNVQRWAQQISEREAVKRGVVVNRFWGEEANLKERHSAKDIDKALK